MAETERKIKAFESIVLVDKTLKEEGHDPASLGRSSAKFIWCTCRYCGNPHRIRKGFFTKAGSACHKECRIKEQSILGSPFENPEVREKSKITNKERYGFEIASKNDSIRNKISESKTQNNTSLFKKSIQEAICSDPYINNVKWETNYLDIYFPDHKFAISINESKNSSELVLSQYEAKKLQITKTKKCEQLGIRVLHIFEHSWEDRKDQYKSFIRNILNNNSRKIYARKCIINNNFNDWFIQDNHLQGFGGLTVKFFNLEHEGEAVMSLTLGRHPRHTKNEKTIVLNRLCSKSSVTVAGGASRLFRAAYDWAKSEGYTKIISWSDNSWTNGDIYPTLGFELDTEYGPDYFYWDMKNNCYRSKQSKKKSNTGCPDGMTEREWCLNNGLYRIWDCGKKRWIADINKGS